MWDRRTKNFRSEKSALIEMVHLQLKIVLSTTKKLVSTCTCGGVQKEDCKWCWEFADD